MIKGDTESKTLHFNSFLISFFLKVDSFQPTVLICFHFFRLIADDSLLEDLQFVIAKFFF